MDEFRTGTVDPKGFDSTAKDYHNDVANATAVAANALIDLADARAPIAGSSNHVLDAGTCTGVVVRALSTRFPNTQILATDVSQPMVEVVTNLGLPNVQTKVVDVMELSHGLQSGSFSHAFSTFMLHFAPDEVVAVKEMMNVLQPGGVVAVGMWGARLGPYVVWEKACLALDPNYSVPDFIHGYKLQTEDAVQQMLQQAGLIDVETTSITMPFAFPSGEAFARFVFESENPAVLGLRESYKEDLSHLRKAVVKIVDEEFDGGQAITTPAILGLGRKRQTTQ